ncbi:MAG TPA: 23S rRNA (guanosine(2251)-2'-O)-methyltransferase RlmB [Pyrinomonadaceae bacterium]|nr:23S rRNA (guanosine(2251)-2'-O)-methyltransferase RlmB [Acidobacteriota bacterium]HQZ96369.1 23S rRNA (guanosine(2251)-2'-O)-methyltransferase RlmB [Pyrinomonadaceae bacterium]
MKPKSRDFREKDRGRRTPERDKRERPAPSPLKTNASLIYGLLPVLEALKAENRRIDKVVIADGAREHRVSEIIDLCRDRSIAWNRVPRETFAKHLESGVNHQGVIAFVAAADYVSTDEIFENANKIPLIVVLDGVEDPRNLGAILRTAEGAGVDGVIIPERRAVGLNDTVAKSSAGAIEYVKVAKTANLNRFIGKLKEKDIWVVGTSMDTEMSYTDWDWTRPSALVLGGEGGGLHRLVAENCDVLVKIPMYGKIDSLNVSVAAGVILFEAQRQRSKDE